MTENFISFSIPEELQQFRRIVKTLDLFNSELEELSTGFNIQPIKDSQGHISEIIYYSDDGNVKKRVYYEGSSVSLIEHYRKNGILSREYYKNGKIIKKCRYDKDEVICYTVCYEYDKDLITSINKSVNDKLYKVKYGYDELGRTNYRAVKFQSKVIKYQKYRYDIIDRIIEYEDDTQKILVEKMSPDNALIKYSIFDKLGNIIKILNKFIGGKYAGTDIDLNGHSAAVVNIDYIDNLMLKKPYPSELDADMAISYAYCAQPSFAVKREHKSDISDIVIKSAVNIKSPIGTKCSRGSSKILPISVRKINLIKKTG